MKAKILNFFTKHVGKVPGIFILPTLLVFGILLLAFVALYLATMLSIFLVAGGSAMEAVDNKFGSPLGWHHDCD